MATIRLTMAQAVVRFLCNQFTIEDEKRVPLCGGVFAIFGHGNVTCLGEALQPVQDILPTWRGQNEQSMAMAAIAYARAKRRRRFMIAASSIGPGATNMVTAAAAAHSNRLPLLLLSGDVFVNRTPDPVLQQVENFGDPTATVNDCFKAGHPLLGSDHPSRSDRVIVAAGARRSARSSRVRAGVSWSVPGRARNRIRLSGHLLRAKNASHPTAARGC